MALLNKEKMMNGFGKAVDAVNDTADKAERFMKEKGIDKKIRKASETIENEVRKMGRDLKAAFSGK